MIDPTRHEADLNKVTGEMQRRLQHGADPEQVTESHLLPARIADTPEDLVAREPWNKVNIDRFRRALVVLGEADPDGIISDRLSGESSLGRFCLLVLNLNEFLYLD